MDTNDTIQLGKKLKTAALIAKAMIATLFVGAVAIELAKAYGMVSFIGDEPAPSIEMMRYVLLAFVVTMFLVMKFTQKKFSSSSVDKVFTVSLSLCALCESTVFSGVMLFMLSGDTLNFHLFAGISLVFFYVFYPRLEQWKQWMQPQPGSEKKAGLFNSVAKESDYKWVYHQYGAAPRIVGAVFSVVVLVMMLVAVRSGLPPGFYLLFALIGIPLTILAFFKSAIEIDRSQGTVNKWWQLFGYRKSKVYRLTEFDAVRITTRAGGQHGPSYVVALSGGSSSVDVHSTRYPDGVRKRAQELADFLGLKFDDTTEQDFRRSHQRKGLFSFK